jgi:hypothetical protein
MTEKPLPVEADITRLAGHRFPGGFYTVAHWENFLLTECTGGELLPLREETRYRVSGGIDSAQRCTNPAGQVYDRIQFSFDVHAPDDALAARTTITWHFTRNTL